MKRTRRDLKDPRIRRIVKEQIRNSSSQYSPRVDSRRPFITPSRIIIFFSLGVLLLALLIIYYPPEFINLNRFSNSGKGSPAETVHRAPEGNPGDIQGKQTQIAGGSETPGMPKTKITPVARRTQVEVLNGCGVDGIASQTTQYLRKNNIDVVDVSNYQNFEVKKTLILDRTGNPEKAREVARLLGIPLEQIKLEKNTSLQLDATIILGSDYKTLLPFQKK